MKTILRVLPLLLFCSVGLFAQISLPQGPGYSDPVTPFINQVWAVISGALVTGGCIWLVFSLVSAGLTGGRLLVSAMSAIFCVYFLLHVQRFVNYLAG